MPFGWANQFPWTFGGKTRTQRIYTALRKALGEGGAGPAGGIEDLWEIVQARVLDAAHSALEMAFYQRFPNKMHVTTLERWEGHLFISPAADLVTRRANLTARFVEQLNAAVPGLVAGLQKISPAFQVQHLDFAYVSQVHLGRMFGPLPGAAGAPYGTGVAAAVQSGRAMNFSDSFAVYVRYYLQPGETMIPAADVAAANAFLNEVLPSWIDYEIYNATIGTAGDGFYLDGGVDGTSLLDQTAFG